MSKFYYLFLRMWTKLWQNFLTNPAVIDFIIEDIKNNADLNLDMFEVGPWKCALTKNLVKIKPDLKVFEKDESFKDILMQCVKPENIILWDFLKANISKYVNTDFFNAVWNLPYYITSPIFRKLVMEKEKKMKYWIFMVQKEVWEKIKTDAKNKSMLWYLLNANFKITYLKTVPASDFSPPPKVDSCLVRFEYTWENEDIDMNDLFNILSIITPIKKKTLWKIQKLLEKQWKKLVLPESLKDKRIHQLSFEELKQIKIK